MKNYLVVLRLNKFHFKIINQYATSSPEDLSPTKIMLNMLYLIR